MTIVRDAIRPTIPAEGLTKRVKNIENDYDNKGFMNLIKNSKRDHLSDTKVYSKE